MSKIYKKLFAVLLTVTLVLVGFPAMEARAAGTGNTSYSTLANLITGEDSTSKCFYSDWAGWYEMGDASKTHEEYLTWVIEEKAYLTKTSPIASITITGDTYRVRISGAGGINFIISDTHTPDYTDSSICRNCGKALPHTHTYSTSWSSDASTHWHAATCHPSVKGSEASHTPGPAATATDPQLCTVCGYEIAPRLHSHTVGTKHEAVPSNCTTAGTIEWYECTDGSCGKNLDAFGNELASIVDPINPSNHTGTTTTWNKSSTTHEETYDCCSAVKTASAGHSYGASGTARYTCSVCSYEDAALKTAAESADAAAAVSATITKIDGIGTVEYTTECKTKIDAARTAYDALSAAQQALVTNIDTLTAAESEYASLEAAAAASSQASGNTTPEMATVNIEGVTFNSWEEIITNTPNLTAEKLRKVNDSNDELLHVNIVGKEDKAVPVAAVQALNKSSITGLHVFIGESDAVTFLNNLDYSKYTGINLSHEDVIANNSRTIDFTSKGKINATVMFHTLIAPNVSAKVYKVVDGKEVEIAILSSNANGGFCFTIDELAKYVIKY